MAFQQPTRQSVQRVPRPSTVEQDGTLTPVARDSSQQRQLEDSQTWVLFSPATDVTTTSYLTETEHSLDTPGRSQLSDLGSHFTASRLGRTNDSALPDALSAVDSESIDDDAELDSLDSHLPEFRSRPSVFQTLSHRDQHHSTPVLPTHDGLGSFRLDQPILSTEAQDQIYQFERFNPRRVRRRLDSFDQAQPEQEYGQAQEAEKRQWIETWRLEHSRMLLDEVQRETRRRRKSQASMNRSHQHEESTSDEMTWHDEDAAAEAPVETEGLVARITRKVVKDLLGIDDKLLSILLGESLPTDEGLSATPRASNMNENFHTSTVNSDEPSWQLYILEKVSRELGLLVNEISQHPGAFSTYSRLQQMTFPYAGLPVIPESGNGVLAAETSYNRRPSQTSLPEFKPTMRQQAEPMNIPGRTSDMTDDAVKEDVSMGNAFTKEEWEKDLDIKLVFRYLLSRFKSQPSTSHVNTSSAHPGPMSSQDSMAKAARVRQHHPLISRSRPTERRTFKATVSTSPAALRPHSSCASQSTRRSARRSSCSSRHYWDIGGSMNTGSVIASHGPMGSWGEV